ncbi:hypothetical protein FRC07_011321 [Ceratobasidium sp. 392]|nr:hypothetical protein FRC07_011321 [Ceratobasidium sp. 392]
MKIHIRSCLILPAADYLKPAKDSKPSNYGVVKHPDALLDGYFGMNSPIHAIRKITTQVLAGIDVETMKNLYQSWLNYYGSGSTRREDWTVINLMTYAREYAAKTLLRGPVSDGSRLYPPTSGQQLPLPEWVIQALDSVVITQPVLEKRAESSRLEENAGSAANAAGSFVGDTKIEM